jgi:hypothetical protein
MVGRAYFLTRSILHALSIRVKLDLVQPPELLNKSIQYSLVLRTMHLGKIKLSYWQEYGPGIKTTVWF